MDVATLKKRVLEKEITVVEQETRRTLEANAFRAALQKERIKFDDNGTLASIDQLDKSAGIEVDPNDRTTPTVGHELTAIEQILGNVGRFNPPAKK